MVTKDTYLLPNQKIREYSQDQGYKGGIELWKVSGDCRKSQLCGLLFGHSPSDFPTELLSFDSCVSEPAGEFGWSVPQSLDFRLQIKVRFSCSLVTNGWHGKFLPWQKQKSKKINPIWHIHFKPLSISVLLTSHHPKQVTWSIQGQGQESTFCHGKDMDDL